MEEWHKCLLKNAALEEELKQLKEELKKKDCELLQLCKDLTVMQKALGHIGHIAQISAPFAQLEQQDKL